LNEARNGTDGDLIRLFYDIWEGTLPGTEYILSAEMPESFERVARSSAADVNRTLRYLNRLGHLVVRGPLDADFVASLVGKEVISVVSRVQPLLQEARSRRADQEYLEYVDRLMEICQQKYPDFEPHYPAEERRGVGLLP
jgi:hypothetical protein